MKQSAFSNPCFSFLSRFATAGLGMVVMHWPVFATSQCMTHLKGKIYTDLPKELCPGYTDMILGRTSKQREYGGIICDRPEASYILLQRLLQQNQQGKAVWQIIQIKSVIKPTPQSLILGVGCQEQNQATPSTEPIFALVQPTPSNTYQTLLAWKVSLDQELFSEIEPQQVVCKNQLI